MITAAAFYALYEKLPDLMHRVLNHREIPARNIELGAKYKLTPAQQRLLVLNESAMIIQDYPPRQLTDHLRIELKLDDAKARALAADVLGYIFLPMEWFLGKIQPLIKDLGGDVDHYLAAAKKTWPEVYAGPGAPPVPPAKPTLTISPEEMEAIMAKHPIMEDFDSRVGSFKGRAEVLLRLTGLSVEVEEAVKSNKITQEQGEQLLRQLDALSYAVNTKDLNALEVEALRRGIKKVLRVLAKVG